MTKNNHSLDHKLALLVLSTKYTVKLSLSFSALFAFILFVALIHDHDHQPYPKHFYTGDTNIFVIVAIYFINSLFTFFLLYEICFWVFRKNWKNWKKNLVAFFVTLAAAMLTRVVVSATVLYFVQPLPEYLFYLPRIFMPMAFIVFFSTLYISTLIRSQQALVENQRLIAENLRARHETLKSQINPHFLFNSLNTLNGLIGVDNEKAKEYVLKLSSVFRYSVQNKEVTTLDDELAFTEAFCHLVKIRFGESLVIESRIEEKYRTYNIMSLSLQTLVENAIKHSTISVRYPLTITIETTDNSTIRVSNKIQPKSEDTSGEGIGLANLAERYKMLYQKEVAISNANGIFSVEIPLIQGNL